MKFSHLKSSIALVLAIIVSIAFCSLDRKFIYLRENSENHSSYVAAGLYRRPLSTSDQNTFQIKTFHLESLSFKELNAKKEELVPFSILRHGVDFITQSETDKLVEYIQRHALDLLEIELFGASVYLKYGTDGLREILSRLTFYRSRKAHLYYYSWNEYPGLFM